MLSKLPRIEGTANAVFYYRIRLIL